MIQVRQIAVAIALIFAVNLTMGQRLYESLRGVKVETNAMNWGPEPGLDTTLNRFHYYMPIYSNGYAFQGNLGLSARPLIFDVDQTPGFQYGPDYHNFFETNADSIKYYMTGGDPYTNVFYMAGGQNEQFLNVKHSQELGRGLNLGADYRVMNAEGQYERQDNSQSNLSVYLRYTAPKQRYRVTANYFGNKFTAEENGGLSDDTTFVTDLTDSLLLFPSPEFYEINLSAEENRFRGRGHYLEQSWMFGKADSVQVEKDSTYQFSFKPNSRIYHTIDHRNRGYSFISESAATDSLSSDYFSSLFYNEKAFPLASVWDSIQHRMLSTRIGWTTHHLDTVTSFWQKKGTFVNAYLEFRRDSVLQAYDTTVINTQTLALDLVQKLPKLPFFAAANFKSTSSQQLSAGQTLNLRIISDFDSLDHAIRIGFATFNRPTTHVHRNFHATRFYWDNDASFENITGQKLSLNYGHRKWRTRFGITRTTLNNWAYFNSGGWPRQYGSPISVTQVELDQPAQIGPLYLRAQLNYQHSDAPHIIAVPELYTVGTIAIQGKLFEGELQGQIGADLTWHSEYYADGYNAVTRQYYRQTEELIGNYPFVDVYFSVAVKRARMFIKWFHVNAGMNGAGFATVPDYPSHFRGLKFGLDWTFWN